MNVPLQITFRDIPSSPAVEERVRELAGKLETLYGRIVGCRVVVEAPHRRHHQGAHYHVRIEIAVRGEDIVVDRQPIDRQEHEDVYVAIRDAFEAAGRQLQDHARKERGQRKRHETPGTAEETE